MYITLFSYKNVANAGFISARGDVNLDLARIIEFVYITTSVSKNHTCRIEFRNISPSHCLYKIFTATKLYSIVQIV